MSRQNALAILKALFLITTVALMVSCAKEPEKPAPPAKPVVQEKAVEPTPAPYPPDSVDEPPKLYYVAQKDLTLYAIPRFQEDRAIDSLPMNEKVLRFKIHRGFAYVKVLRTHKTGWLDNGALDWKKVSSESGAKAQDKPEATGQEPVVRQSGAAVSDSF